MPLHPLLPDRQQALRGYGDQGDQAGSVKLGSLGSVTS
jgi:hypothetical protein